LTHGTPARNGDQNLTVTDKNTAKSAKVASPDAPRASLWRLRIKVRGTESAMVVRSTVQESAGPAETE
jgi:hypothetical protein